MPALRTLAVVALTATALGCGSASPSSSEPHASTRRDERGDDPRPGDGHPAALGGRAPTRDEEHALAEARRVAEELRGLRFDHAVPTRVQSRRDIEAFIVSRIDDDELREARTFYVALGLLPADVDVRALLISVMGEQIVGFYDDEVHELVVRDDVMASLARRAARGQSVLSDPNAMVVVHEYVHALQDQRLGLHHDEEATIDEANAYASLVEGDATLTMLGLGMARSGRRLEDLTRDLPRLRSLVAEAPSGGDSALARAPAILRAPLLSRYVDGLLFVGALHGVGAFRALDEAYASRPTTTEQVLHPERYLRGEARVPLALPALGELRAEGFEALDEDTLGELELSVFLAVGAEVSPPDDRERSAADGWAGDRIRVYRRVAATREAPAGATTAGEAVALVWFIAFDDEHEALEALPFVDRAAQSIRASEVRVTRAGRVIAIDGGLPSEARHQVDEALQQAASALQPPSHETAAR